MRTTENYPGEPSLSDLLDESHGRDPGTWSETDAPGPLVLAKAETELNGLKHAAQMAADTMGFWNDSGDFDRALAALAEVGIVPDHSAWREETDGSEEAS